MRILSILTVIFIVAYGSSKVKEANKTVTKQLEEEQQKNRIMTFRAHGSDVFLKSLVIRGRKRRAGDVCR